MGTLSEVIQYAVGGLTLPDDGDANTIESITAAFQELLNRSALDLAGAAGLMRGADEFSVNPNGSNSSFRIALGSQQSIVLPNETNTLFQAFIYTGTPAIDETKVAGGVLANSTRYHVYVFNNAGTLDVEIVTTVPLASRVHKSGGGLAPQARRYVGTFATDSSGNPIPVRAVRGDYTFRRSALAANALRALNGSATSWTTVDLSAFIPAHVRLVRVELVAAGGGTVGSAQLRTKDDTAGGVYYANVTGTAFDTDRVVYEIETDSAHCLEYQVSHASIAAEIHVCGFKE